MASHLTRRRDEREGSCRLAVAVCASRIRLSNRVRIDSADRNGKTAWIRIDVAFDAVLSPGRHVADGLIHNSAKKLGRSSVTAIAARGYSGVIHCPLRKTASHHGAGMARITYGGRRDVGCPRWLGNQRRRAGKKADAGIVAGGTGRGGNHGVIHCPGLETTGDHRARMALVTGSRRRDVAACRLGDDGNTAGI